MKSLLKFIWGHPLASKHRVRALLRLISWQLMSFVAKEITIFDWVDGSKFYVRKGETGLTGNIYTGLHEFTDMSFLLHLLRSDDLFIDVGANSGSYTILASAVSRARTISIEPVKSTYLRLQRNIELNNIESLCDALNIGIADQNGLMWMTGDQDTTNHLLINSVNDASEEVTVKTLDQITHGKNPLLIKIDVEGWEMPVLKGASHTLEDSSLLAVILELNGSGETFGFSDSEIIDVMHTFGFVEYTYNPFLRILSVANGKNLFGNNTLFLRNLPEVEKRVASGSKRKIFMEEF